MHPSSTHPHAVHAGRDSPQDKTCRYGFAGQRSERQEHQQCQQRELQHSLRTWLSIVCSHYLTPENVAGVFVTG